jgi:UDP-N-acetylmuramyl pentapeptide synthase
VALAKRELIEALDPQSGIAVLNADDPRVLRFREIHPGRTITFGLSDGADVRATDLSPSPPKARNSKWMASISTPRWRAATACSTCWPAWP